jgi:hypothetical protein
MQAQLNVHTRGLSIWSADVISKFGTAGRIKLWISPGHPLLSSTCPHILRLPAAADEGCVQTRLLFSVLAFSCLGALSILSCRTSWTW